MPYDIPLFDLNYGPEEERAVAEVLRSGWISAGPRTEELERRFAEHLGAAHAVALSSGTAALHLALASLGVGAGDGVIVPSLTFVATVNAVRYVGATPVFADATNLEDFSIDPEDVRRKITPKTRAILPMHYGGFACDMDALGALARERGLLLIEDAAHAPDAECGGRKLGSIGQAGCFSFYSNKNLSCGEGGLLALDDAEAAQRARRMRSHGMTTLSFDRAQGRATAYDVVETGYNYRIDDMRAALALAQFEKLEADTRLRAEVRRQYLERLGGLEALIVPYVEHRGRSSNYIFPVVLRDANAERRDAVRRSLAERGIETSVHYPAAHRFAVFQDCATSLPVTETVADTEITLPMYGALSEGQVDRVAEALRQAL
jgi:dTDP-4-amino-4,6-dideoxygalactose transaminase